MAIKKPWEEFPEIYNSSGGDIVFKKLDEANKRNAQELQNDAQEMSIAKAARTQAINDVVSEKLKSGTTSMDEILELMRDTSFEQGDALSGLTFEEQIKKQKRDVTSEQMQGIKSAVELKKLGLGDEEIGQLLGNYGLDGFDLSQIKDKSGTIKGGLTEGMWREGPNGEIEILREPRKPAGGADPDKITPRLITMADGQTVMVRSMSEYNQALSEGGKPYQRPISADKQAELDTLKEIAKGDEPTQIAPQGNSYWSGSRKDKIANTDLPKSEAGKIPKAGTATQEAKSPSGKVAPKKLPGEDKAAYLRRMIASGIAQ